MELRDKTTDADVLAVLDFMKSNGIPAWLHGGWALEALGCVKRPHSDIDLLVDDCYRERLRRMYEGRVFNETSHKFELNHEGAGIDLIFFRHRSGGLKYSITPRIVVVWPRDVTDYPHPGRLAERDVPIVSPMALYIEIANKVRKKKDMLEKNSRDLECFAHLLTEEQIARATRHFPLETSLLNRLRVRFGSVK